MIIIALGYLLILGQTILVPMVLGLLFSILLLPLSNFMEKKMRFTRSVSSLISSIIFVIVFAGILFFLISQIIRLSEDWPAFQTQFHHTIEQLQHYIYQHFGIEKSDQQQYIQETATQTVNSGTQILGFMFSSISSVLILLLFSFLYTFFLLFYRRHIVKFLIINFVENHHTTVLEIVSETKFMVKKYLIGLVIQMLLVSGMTFLAFSLIGIKYTLMLALLTGILNVLPYIGIALASILSVVIAFATGTGTQVILVIIALIVIHAIDGNYIMPKIVGSKVKLNSLVAMVAIVIGQMIWGISGMFLAIPITAIAKIIFDRTNGLKAWGFLMGEPGEELPLFNKAIMKIFNERIKRKKKSA